MRSFAEKNHLIRIAGTDIPVYLVWNKINLLREANALLDRLNRKYPDLCTHLTHSTVGHVKQVLGGLDIRPPHQPRDNPDDACEYARQLLLHLDPESALSVLHQEKQLDLDLRQLVTLVGLPSYLDAMTREGLMLRRNAISDHQIAQLWNEGHLPAAETAFWQAATVKALLD